MKDGKLGEADRIHLLAEASKAAYRQRDALVADPTVSPFDTEAFLSDQFVGRIRKEISLEKAVAPETFDMPLHKDTIYLCVVDGAGNMAVSYTHLDVYKRQVPELTEQGAGNAADLPGRHESRAR